MYTLTVNIAAAGTPTGNGGSSYLGHMWYSTSDGTTSQSYGFGPKTPGTFDGDGQETTTDSADYQSYSSQTVTITQSQYETLQQFGSDPQSFSFDTGTYDGFTNNCIDFTWTALGTIGIQYPYRSLPEFASDPALLPTDNLLPIDIALTQFEQNQGSNPSAPPPDDSLPPLPLPDPTAPWLPFFPPGIGPTYPGQSGGSFSHAEKDRLVIDFAGNGLNLTAEAQEPAYFDWNGGNFANLTGWVGAGTGFLVLAPTNGGTITAADFVTSFAQLEALDVNHTGTLNSSDPGFANLEVWEGYGDGAAEQGEVFTLAQLGIQSINLNDQTTHQILAGNTVEAVSSVTMTNGTTQEIASVAFDYSTNYTAYVGPDTPSTAAAALPQLHGYGNLPDLQEAMTTDPTLLAMVQSFVQMAPTDSTALGTAIANIMFEWAGVDGVDPTSFGPLFNAQQVDFLEQFLGVSYHDVHGFDVPHYFPEADALAQSWTAAYDGIAARLLLQGPMSSALADFIFDASSDLIVCTTSFSQALQDVAAQAPTDSTAALQYWWAAVTVLDSYVADWQAIDGTTGASVVPATQADYDAMLTAVAPELTESELTTLRAISFGGYTQTGSSGSGVFAYNPSDGSVAINVNAGDDGTITSNQENTALTQFVRPLMAGCVRNKSGLENLHSGNVPGTQTADYSGVKIVPPTMKSRGHNFCDLSRHIPHYPQERAENGLRTVTPARARSATFRVTTVRPWTMAVAAISPSMAGSGSGIPSLPHASATRSSTGRMRAPSLARSLSSHSISAAACSASARRLSSMPRRISPITSTLVCSSWGLTDAAHRTTPG